MIRRIIVVASLVVVLALGAGVAAFAWHARAIAALVTAQAAAARSLLDAGETSPQVLASAVLRPGLHVVVEDHAKGQLYDTQGARLLRPRALPPGPNGGPPPDLPGQDGGPPGQDGGPPDLDGGPPEQGDGPPGQEGGPPLAPAQGVPPRAFVIQLAGIVPERVRHGAFAVLVTPDVQDFQRFALADLVFTLLAALAAAGLGVALVVQVQRIEHKQLEDTLEERRAAAAEFQRFLADAGHELRTPLTIVSGYVDILSAKAVGDGADARILAGMRAETARMRGLVEKMLMLARLETPVSVPRLIDPASVARDVADAMQPRFPNRTIELKGDRPASLVIDYDDLYEALRNLVENALRYAPGSPVTIETAAHGGFATLRVSDRGPGIRAEEREAIFERFYRGRNSTDGEGSGLGLAIVKRVATRWNGEITVDSDRAGTTFTLRFPLADEETDDVVAR